MDQSRKLDLADMFAAGGTSHRFGSLELADGDRVAVVGGGPAGAAFSIFFLSLARELGRDISLTIFERKDFTRAGPVGCNQCAGVVSESLLATLSIEGVRLAEPIVQHGVDSYRFVMPSGDATLRVGTEQHAIATVYRAGGPLKGTRELSASFDSYMLDMAEARGAKVEKTSVDSLECRDGRFAIFSEGEQVGLADLLVGAFGHRPTTAKAFEDLGFGYRRPKAAKVLQVEIPLDPEDVSRYFGGAVVVTMRPIKGVEFCALTPKSDGLTMTLLGRDIEGDTPTRVLSVPHIRKLFPPGMSPDAVSCRCMPLLTVTPARNPFGDRVVIVGDACVSKLFKDGIGSAFITARAAANCALLAGVSREAFRERYLPACAQIAKDNRYGALLLFYLAPLISRVPGLAKTLIAFVNDEREHNRDELTGILWDVFTGTNPYRSVFMRGLSPALWARFATTAMRVVFGRGKMSAEEERRMGGAQLGKVYRSGDEIVKQGDMGREMYVILSGAAEVFVGTDEGRRKLADLGVGDFFGEMALFGENVRSATVVARGETRVLAVDKASLLARISQNPTLGLRIIETMSKRIRDLNVAAAACTCGAGTPSSE
jgi:flavin-dependent dehydrogenase